MARYSNVRAVDGANIGRVNPKLLAAMNRLARARGVVIDVNSGYRTPQHSVAVGGFANDPHTRGIAVDAYINGRPIGSVIPPSVWAKYGVQSGDVPNFYNGKPDPEHLQLSGSPSGGPPANDVVAHKALARQMLSGGIPQQQGPTAQQQLLSYIMTNNAAMTQQPHYGFVPFQGGT